MKRRGRGMACMWYPIGFTAAANPSSATVTINEDGTATLLTGTVEGGQGLLTALAQIAAETLGIAPQDVHVVSGDTDATPMDTGAIASRTTYVGGNAVRLAALQAREVLLETAMALLHAEWEALETRDGWIRVKGSARGLRIAQAARHAYGTSGTPPIGSATWNPPTTPLDETGQGEPFATYVYATQIAEVEVDDETGEVRVLRIVAAHDCGAPVNPMLVEGQVHGGIAMGVGFALHEEIRFDAAGRQLNPTLSGYLVPTSADTPQIEVAIVDNRDPTGPFGAKGVGEPTSVPTAAAIANAIYDAVGVRITSLPATPEKVLAAITSSRACCRTGRSA
jgi:CO/xanthine dehydrogenase Mo-binding subunit